MSQSLLSGPGVVFHPTLNVPCFVPMVIIKKVYELKDSGLKVVKYKKTTYFMIEEKGPFRRIDTPLLSVKDSCFIFLKRH